VNTIKIIIADSHFLSRKGLSVLLNANADFMVLAEALSTSDLVNQSKLYKPDLIIIDYTSVNYSLDGLRQIVKKYPKAKLLAITDLQTSQLFQKH